MIHEENGVVGCAGEERKRDKEIGGVAIACGEAGARDVKLPYVRNAAIALGKARYLLDASHPQNGGKAAFFLAFGFRLDAPEVLAEALLRHVLSQDVTDVQQHPYGTRYTVSGPLDTPDGRNPIVDAGWFIDPGSIVPRLTTATPGRKGAR